WEVGDRRPPAASRHPYATHRERLHGQRLGPDAPSRLRHAARDPRHAWPRAEGARAVTEERIGGDPRPSTKLLQLVALFVMLLTLLKGIAFPHPWATTHLLFNYQHGFIKRALL